MLAVALAACSSETTTAPTTTLAPLPATTTVLTVASTATTATATTSTTSTSTTSSTTSSTTTTVAPTTIATNVAPTAPPTEAPTTVADAPAIDATAYIVMDAATGEVLAAQDANVRHPVGSLMKLLTAYVVMQAGDPTKKVIVPPLHLDPDEKIIFLKPGQRFGRDVLLRAMLIVSAGDAAQALAVDVGGTMDAFVEQMNAAAAALGLADTHAANADGLDDDQGYSTVADMAALSRLLLQDPEFAATVARPSATLFGQEFPATNTLLGSYPGANGVKTGHTTNAGYCLAASATRDGRTLIAVVLGTPSIAARDAAATAALDWGFAQSRG